MTAIRHEFEDVKRAVREAMAAKGTSPTVIMTNRDYHLPDIAYDQMERVWDIFHDAKGVRCVKRGNER